MLLPCIYYQNTGSHDGPLFSSPTQNRIENQMLCFDGPSFLQQTQNKFDQSGYEPLNLENGSSVNSGNFDATDLRF